VEDVQVVVAHNERATLQRRADRPSTSRWKLTRNMGCATSVGVEMTIAERRRRIPSRTAAFLVVVVVILAACSGVDRLASGVGATDPIAARQRAHAVLEAWAKAVAAVGAPRVIPVGELTSQIGDWEPAVGDNNKRALMSGLVLTETPLSDATPPDGLVTWQDGKTTNVRLLSAQQALVAIGTTVSSACDGCAPVMVTAPRLTSAEIDTTRGPATAPLWEFTVQGSAVKLTRVAIANPVFVPPGEGDPQLGIAIDAATGTVGVRELSVAFIGAPDPADQPCGEDYTAEAVESELAVVVIVTRHPHPPGPFGQACPAVGARRTTTATLSAALGDRVVLDLLRGTPVTVVVGP
jgi:hypothetical protein